MDTQATRAEKVFVALLHLYPASYRNRFSHEMRQLFRDLYRDHLDSGRSNTEFWGGLVLDTLGAAAHEHIESIRKLPIMKLSFANNASPKALFWGFVCLLPAAIFMSIAIIARGLGLPFLGGTALSGAGQTFFILSLLILPLVALVVNLVALTRHLMINSNQAVRGSFTTRYFWTVALVGVSVLWFVFLLGHDTIGCGLQYVTHLDWAAFSRCNTAH